MSDIKQNMKRGIFWTAIDKYSSQIVALLIAMVLARLLTPYEFGVVTTASVLLGFLTIFTSIGIAPAVIQRKDLTQEDLDNIFTFTIYLGIVVGGISFCTSWPIARFYGNELLAPLVQILSVGLFLGSVNIVPSALMSKNLRFKEKAKMSFAFQVIFGVAGIVCAFYGAGAYALVCPSIVASVCTYLYNNHFYPVHFRWNLSLEPVKKIFSFSVYVFCFEFVNYFSRNLDKLIIGKVFSPEALGYYDKSYRLMQMPLNNVSSVIAPVIQPILSKYQDDMETMSRMYTKIVSFIALISFPIATVLYFCADEIIIVCFGEQWAPAIPVFRILSLAVPLMLVLNPTGGIFMSCNKSRMMFFSGMLNTSITISGFIIATYMFQTLESIAWGWTIPIYINFFTTYFLLYNVTMKSSMLKMLKVFVHPVGCTFFMSLAYIGYSMLRLELPHLINLILLLAVGGVTLVVYLYLSGQYKVINYIRNK